MLGAIIGDMIGSVYESKNLKSKSFPLFNKHNRMTDDSYLTIAVAEVLLKHYPLKYDDVSVKAIQEDLINNFTIKYKNHLYAGWGKYFSDWAKLPKDIKKPYYSFGNGGAMRVSPVGWLAKSEEEVKVLSRIVTEITHNHPEGLKSAEAVAMCIYLARTGKSKDEIKSYVITNYYPQIANLDYQTLVDTYTFDVTAQNSVPQAIYCFLISTDFIDAIRTSVSIGGDCDTMTSITTAIAEASYQNESTSEFEQQFLYLFIESSIENKINEFQHIVKNK